MDPISLLVSVAGAAALILQGVSSLVKREKPNALGAIDLTLGALAIALVVVLRAGSLVIATDFGLLMAQGEWTVFAVRVVIVTSAILPALCWNRARSLNAWPASRAVAILAAVPTGLWAAIQAKVLNPADPAALQFLGYDVWWLPLVAWIALCSSGCMLALVGLRGIRHGVALTAAVLAPLSMFALRWPTLLDRPSIADARWQTVEWASFFVAVFALAQWPIPRAPSWRRLALPLAAAAAATALFRLSSLPAAVTVAIGCAPLVVMTITLFTVVIERSRETSSASPGQPNRIHALCLAGSPPIIALGVIDVTSIGWMPRALDIALIVGFWILLAERLGDSMLTVQNLGQFWRFAAVCFLRDLAAGAWRRVRHAAAGIRDFFAVKPDQSGWVVGMKGAFAFITALLFWAVVNEAWSARPIVIRPFQWAGAEDDGESKAATAALSASVINALGRLRHDLSVDQATTVRKSIGAPPAALALLARADSNALENAVAQSSDIEISGLKLSARFFLPFVEDVVRSAMGVRVIEGTVRKGKDGIVVMMSSSRGGSWRVSEKPIEGLASDGMCVPPSFDDPRAAVVERLAFDIVSDDPGYAASGLTSDFNAFLLYRRGLRAWDEHESGRPGENGSTAALQTAIDCFREAARLDRRFAQAYYHLGVALQSDGQPRAAIEALRSSVTDGEVFVAAVLQEASTQYNFTSYTANESAILPPVAIIDAVHASRFGASGKSALQQERDEALRLWATVIALPRAQVSRSEARAAYFGICQYETDNLWWLQPPTDFFVPYFYCSRANALWSWATAETADAERSVEAGVLTYLGLAMAHHDSELKKIPASAYPRGWSCAEASLNLGYLDDERQPSHYFTNVSHRLGRAVDYFRASLQLVPADDFTRCLLAASRVALDGNIDDMRALQVRPQAHYATGWDVLNNAHREAHAAQGGSPTNGSSRANATWYYSRALYEFETAISQDPGLVEVLDMYGYVVWQWTLDTLEHRTTEGPDPAALERAEAYAREAARLSNAWRKGNIEKSARSTVGELLIAEGRPANAVAQLTALLADSNHWEGEDELLWDLAQGKLCLAQQSTESDAQKLRTDARDLFAQLVNREQSRDRRGFTEAEPEGVNLHLRESRCPVAAVQSE